jgi:hypothetical protein
MHAVGAYPALLAVDSDLLVGIDSIHRTHRRSGWRRAVPGGGSELVLRERRRTLRELQVKGKPIPRLIDGAPGNRLVIVYGRIRNGCPALALNAIAIVVGRQGDSHGTLLASSHFSSFSTLLAARWQKQTSANSQQHSKLHARRHGRFLSFVCNTTTL